MSSNLPIVYTIRGCAACVKLLEKWNADGVEYVERRAELSQAMMDEARQYGSAVPIIVWPDGRSNRGLRIRSGATSSDAVKFKVWARSDSVNGLVTLVESPFFFSESSRTRFKNVSRDSSNKSRASDTFRSPSALR